MRFLVEKITKNPYFVLVGWLATIIALIIAIVVPFIQARKVCINYTYTTNPLVTDSLSEMEGLDINFNGKKINQLSVTTCKLVNNGNVTIEDSDVYKGHKITIFPTSDNVDIYFACIISQSYDTINSRIKYDNKSLTWCFDTLERSDEVIINIYHSGRENVTFSIDGRIKEGKITLLNSQRVVRVISIVLLITVFILVIISAMRFTKFKSVLSGDIISIMSIIVAIIGILVATFDMVPY